MHGHGEHIHRAHAATRLRSTMPNVLRCGAVACAPCPAACAGVIPSYRRTCAAGRLRCRPLGHPARPHVDRLACAWFIRRFINRDATIRYAMEPAIGEIAFDMADARFGHQGNLCTFETMVRAFGLDDPALHAVAEVVHEIDLREPLCASRNRWDRPHFAGVAAPRHVRCGA